MQNIRAFLFLLPVTFLFIYLAFDTNDRQNAIEKTHRESALKSQIEYWQVERLVSESYSKIKADVQVNQFFGVPAVPRTQGQTQENNKSGIIENGGPVPDGVIRKIKDFEAFYPKTYWDSAGKLTIGYGFTKDVIPTLKKGDTITKAESDRLLVKLITDRYLPCIRKSVKVPLDGHQIGSLVSLIHNIGIPAFERSQLLKYINEGDFDNAADEFDRWIHVNGDVDSNLKQRRKVEKRIFLALYTPK